MYREGFPGHSFVQRGGTIPVQQWTVRVDEGRALVVTVADVDLQGGVGSALQRVAIVLSQTPVTSVTTDIGNDNRNVR